MGTNYGAKQYDRVKDITRVFAIAATLLALLFYLPVMLAPKVILSLFITTPSIVEEGAADFRLFFLSFIVLVFWIVILTLMQALGRAAKASLLVLLRQLVLYIPAAALMPHVAGLGVHGVFCAPLLTDAVVLLIAVGMLVSELKQMNMQKQWKNANDKT